MEQGGSTLKEPSSQLLSRWHAGGKGHRSTVITAHGWQDPSQEEAGRSLGTLHSQGGQPGHSELTQEMQLSCGHFPTLGVLSLESGTLGPGQGGSTRDPTETSGCTQDALLSLRPGVRALSTPCPLALFRVTWGFATSCGRCSVVSDSATPWTVPHQAPLSRGFSRSTILEWVAISFSRRSSQQGDPTRVSWVGGWVLYFWATKEAWWRI